MEQVRLQCPKCKCIVFTLKSICSCGADLHFAKREVMEDIFDAILDDEKGRILNRSW